MRLQRLHTQKDSDPAKGAASRLYVDGDGSEYAVPRQWGESAAAVLAQKVFSRQPVPALLRAVPEEGVPEFLWRREADQQGLDGISAEWRYRYERDFNEVFARIAGGLCYHAWKAGVFDSSDDARAFYDEFRFLLLHQIAAPEIRLLASAGMDWAYGMEVSFAPAAGIAGFSDALFGYDIAGAGVAVSPAAPEKNLLRRLKLLAEKQAVDGDGRRLSVTFPVENIDSPSFVNLKRQGDIAAVAQEMGGKALERALHHVMDACDRDSVFGFDPKKNGRLMQAMIEARRAGVPENALNMAIHYAEQGFEDLGFASAMEDATTLPLDLSLSVPDEFIESALTAHGFMLLDAGEAKKHYPAEKLWNNLAAAVWQTGEPAVFFRDSAAGASVVQSGQGLSVSGQGGFVFLAGTSAPAATINLQKLGHGEHIVDAEKLGHAVTVMTVALEASFALVKDAGQTNAYRPVSIGVSGLSSLLMANMLAYDSDAGRATAALVVALASAFAHEASAQLATSIGAFPGYAALEKEYLQNLKDRMGALSGTAHLPKGLSRRPAELKAALCPDATLADAVRNVFARAYVAGKEKGFRHAHLTAMDTGADLQALLGAQARDIAPLAALVRFEGHYEGGAEAEIYGKKLNPAVPQALHKMGFGAKESDDIVFYAVGHGTLFDAPAINHVSLKSRGFHQAALDALESALPAAQHIRYVFNKWTLGADFCRHMLGFSEEDLSSGTFDMLAALGFSEDDIDAANLYCCGAMTLEGAPHLHPKHLAVFDCLAPSGAGVRRVSPEAQIRMQAGVEPFLSGAACHTIELGHYASVDDVQKLLLRGWELGVKRLKLYRDGCSLLHAAVPAENETLAEEETPAEIARIRVVS